ncbi:MAG: ROK family protein [Actinomycetes bacterium]
MPTVGVDLGGTNVSVIVLGDDDARLGTSRMKTPLGGDRTTVLDVMDAAVHAALGDAGVALEDVSTIGVGTPGVVIDGTVGGATNVPGWYERFSLAEGLSSKIGRPVRVANDVTAAAVAEHRFGAGAGTQHLLVVFVGTGVGAGVIIDGEPYEGAVGGAGEFGHTVVQLGGAMCPCGRRGCVEAYAGRRAMEHAAERAVTAGRETVLFKVAEDKGKSRITSGVVKAALDLGDELTADLLDKAVAALGAGIASAVNLLDVDAVVVGGGLADRLGPWFLTRVDAAMRPHLFLQPPRITLSASTLGDEGGALGAALMARRGPSS